MKKTVMSLFVLLLVQVVMVGMSGYWSRSLPFENWNYLGAWIYFVPIFFLNYGPRLGGELAAFSQSSLSVPAYVFVTFVTLVIRDSLIGNWFYPGWEWVYLGFLSYAVVAMGASYRIFQFPVKFTQEGGKESFEHRVLTVSFKAMGVLFGSLGFFLISNFGVWWQGGLYTRDLEGFLQCYWLALPFFKTTISSDLVFSFLFFVLVESVMRGFEQRQRGRFWVAG
ncbi:MAG: hypothetical protein N2Z70_06085 [Bdellovibrionaceae bacterium]|nr:hypothetical protein [Pseudobdellovibrionaceae bacterium]